MQLLDDRKEMRGYWKLKEEALDRTVWRTRFGRGCGPVVRQTTEWVNDNKQTRKRFNLLKPSGNFTYHQA
jgi:hypothetical protein